MKKIFLIIFILGLTIGCTKINTNKTSEIKINKSEKTKAIRVSNWLNKNFEKELKEATKGTPFTISLLSAIVTQESGYYLVENNRIDLIDKDTLLKNCILDASGDVDGTRKAFPRNTDEFRKKYGNKITDELINEANRARKFRGFTNPKKWVYAGYGLFQFDLQYIELGHKEFFIEKQWYSFDKILKKVIIELTEKYNEDLWEAVRKYNGSGSSAIEYANHVFTYKNIIEEKDDSRKIKIK